MTRLRIAKQSDLNRIARCHKEAFPRSLMSKLGVPYLEKVFSWYLSTEKAFLFFLEEEGYVVGYTGGMIVDGTLAHGSASSLAQHTFNDSVKALLFRPWLFFHPDLFSRYPLLVRNVITRISNLFRREEVRSAVRPLEPYVGLVVIGVHPSFQGKGYGSAMLTEFERKTFERGMKRMLLTVESDNYRAIETYERNGWKILEVNKVSKTMEKRLI